MTKTLERPAVTLTQEERRVYVPERPMTFAEYLDAFGPKDFTELVKGVPQERMAAQLEHELLIGDLYGALRSHAQRLRLGQVLSSRTPVQIGAHGARLPDLLFVRQENVPHLEPKGIRFAPDMVIEIVSPGDRPSEQVALESDYRSIGVSEIIFVDRRRGRVRVARRTEAPSATTDGYSEEILAEKNGVLRLESFGGITIPLLWLLTDDRPIIDDIVAHWTAERPSA